MINLFKIVSISLIITCLAAVSTSQSKSLEEIRSEINGLPGAGSFSVTYERDITTVRLFYDVREDNQSLDESFKQFEIELCAIYSGPGIDEKPYRTRLCITTVAKRFHFASNRDLLVSVNGESIDFGTGERATRLKGRKTTEILCWDIDKELMKEFGNSNNAGFLIGGWKVSIPPLKSALIKDYWKLLHEFRVGKAL